MRLILLRHCETDWNRQPARCQGWAEIGLNQTGRAQARERAQALAGRAIELIVTSHLQRARETAEIVRDELGTELPLIVDPRLAETHRGEWEARLFGEIMQTEVQTWREYREHPESFRFPGGESLREQQRRVLGTLRDVAQDGRQALLVTHGGSMRVARCFLRGGHADVETDGLDTFHDVHTDNGTIDEVATEGLARRISAFLAT
jgi:broad specificity phosphatase PhoE